MNRIHPVGSSISIWLIGCDILGPPGLSKLFAAVSSGDASHKTETDGLVFLRKQTILTWPSL